MLPLLSLGSWRAEYRNNRWFLLPLQEIAVEEGYTLCSQDNRIPENYIIPNSCNPSLIFLITKWASS